MGIEITVPMPRLTNTDYYQRYRFIRHIWRYYQNLFALIPIELQYDLHNFYQPDRDLTKAELITYRKDIKHEDPGLPARASKAYVRLHQAYENVIADTKNKQAQKEQTPHSRKHRKIKHLSVRAVVRPEPDWNRFAYALLQHAKMKVEQEKGGKPSPKIINNSFPSLPSARGTAEAVQQSLDL